MPVFRDGFVKLELLFLDIPEAIALSTLAELAAETDIATSAFVRFAQTLGFDGFSQMQSVFRQQVRNSWPQYGSRLSKIADVEPADHLEALSSPLSIDTQTVQYGLDDGPEGGLAASGAG